VYSVCIFLGENKACSRNFSKAEKIITGGSNVGTADRNARLFEL